MAEESTAAVVREEPPGERRRRQFIEIARRLIEEEGVEAVRVPRVAELAGCGRTLFYRYFPRREDLLMAILTEYYELLSGLSPEMIDAGLRGFVAGDDAEIPEGSKVLMNLVWDGLDRTGPAGLILRSAPNLNRELKEHAQTFRAEYDSRWHRPLRAIGMTELEADVAVEAGLYLLNTLYARVRAGEVPREEAIDVWLRALRTVTRGLRSNPR